MIRNVFQAGFFSSVLLLAFISSADSAPFISGVVLNQNGQPLPGAFVHYRKNNVKDTTDNLGRYSIDVAATSIKRADPFFTFDGVSPQGNKTEEKLYNLGGRLLSRSNYESLNLFIVKSLNNPPEIRANLSKSTTGPSSQDSLFFAAFGKSPQTIGLQPNQTNVADVTMRGTVTTYNGYTEYDFTIAGRATKLVVPKTALPSKPWIWRCRFWDHWPEVDKALLAMGYHLVYLDIIEWHGAPISIGWWNQYYDLLTNYYGFNKKCVLEGMSRGGLTIFQWALQKPNAVQAMYADAVVADLRTYPGFAELQRTYGFKDSAEYKAYTGHPVDNLKILADVKVPIFLVVGDQDNLYARNMILESRYRALSGPIQVTVKPGVGHTHGLPSPKPIVDYVHSFLTN